jgi:hypothetical protein
MKNYCVIVRPENNIHEVVWLEVHPLIEGVCFIRNSLSLSLADHNHVYAPKK